GGRGCDRHPSASACQEAQSRLIENHSQTEALTGKVEKEKAMERPFLEKITSRSLRVGVIGLGYVGLPLATTFAEAGFHVTGIDTDQQKIDAANRGESYIPDIPSARLQTLIDTKRLYFTSDYAALEDIDAVSICVPTPLRKTRDPDVSYIIAATQQVRAHLHPGQLVVLESTTYPGTTDEVVLPELESTGLKVG